MNAPKTEKQRLRKQPKMRRVHSSAAAALPQTAVPKTAKKRKRRNSTQRLSRPLATAQSVLLSARWLSLGLLAACLYALYLIGGNDLFYLNFIPVEGTTNIPPAEIADRSGLAGRHIFTADPQDAAEKVLELPGITSATVTLRWPNDVLIQVTEEAPMGIWEENGQQYWIGSSGELVPARTESVGLLRIISEMDLVTVRRDMALEAAAAEAAADTDSQTEDDQTGNETEESPAANLPTADMAFVPEEVMQGALLLRELRPNIDRLYYRPSGGLSYQDGRGWRAYFGTGRDMHQKLVVYETVVEELLARGLQPEYISVSNQEKPFYRLVQ